MHNARFTMHNLASEDTIISQSCTYRCHKVFQHQWAASQHKSSKLDILHSTCTIGLLTQDYFLITELARLFDHGVATLREYHNVGAIPCEETNPPADKARLVPTIIKTTN